MQPEGPRRGECREANQEGPPAEGGMCRPRPRRVRILRQRVWQVLKIVASSASCEAREAGMGCWAWELVNSPMLKALKW